MDDRPRKDRLIQTRVPQDLESTLKDEARKRRLSVSHLIRNVLEDTFSLVDNVVSEVDRVVHDSVGVAQALKRDARRLAATARGETAHRKSREAIDTVGVETSPSDDANDADDADDDEGEPEPEPATPPRSSEAQSSGPASETAWSSGALADVYGFQELVLNHSAQCASCGTAIARGARAHLGMTDRTQAPRVWVCQSCLEKISE